MNNDSDIMLTLACKDSLAKYDREVLEAAILDIYHDNMVLNHDNLELSDDYMEILNNNTNLVDREGNVVWEHDEL
jgi:hypothetical protein